MLTSSVFHVKPFLQTFCIAVSLLVCIILSKDTVHIPYMSSCLSLSLSLSQAVPFPHGVEITSVAHNSAGKHFLALSKSHEVYAWGAGDNGMLGLGTTK